MQVLLIVCLLRIFLAISSLDSKIPDGPLLRTMDFLSDVNKSQWAYGFFKRDINKRLAFEFTVHKMDGAILTLKKSGFSFFAPNREYELRFYNMAGSFLNDSLSQKMMARSIGVFLLNRFERAYQVDIIADFEVYPGLDEYTVSHQPQHQRYYQATVSLY